MELKKRAFAGLGWWGPSKRLGVRLALVAAGIAVAGGGAHAVPDADCNAINRGDLNVALEAEGSATRQIVLKAGDRLTFSFEAAAGPFGTLTLRNGAGAPRSLLVGPTGTSVSFVAAKGGAFAFEFSKEGTEAAAFTASCAPAGSARGGASPAVSRRSARLFGETWKGAENIEGDELAGVILDAGAPDPSRGSAARPWMGGSNPAGANALPHAGGLDTRLQWRGERYKVGGPGRVRDRHLDERCRCCAQL